MNAREFGAWLKEQRKNTKLSQEKAAERIGVSGAAVSRWESGIDSPDRARFAAIEAAYGMAPGVVEKILLPPARGPSLDYWVGRWEQQTMHFRRVLADQEALLVLMRERAEIATPPDAEVERTASDATLHEAGPVPIPD